jgi:hypothetical protein
MNAHTPGPWEASSIGEGLPLTHIGHVLAAKLGGGFDSYCIALLAGTRPHEETSANARLIAAAPDLLEACRAMVYKYGQLENGPGSDPRALNVALAAIAKAGSTP